MTAYRQAALRCAGALQAGPCRTRDVAKIEPEAPRILLRNVYGWFERVERGTYRLTPQGENAVRRSAGPPTEAGVPADLARLN